MRSRLAAVLLGIAASLGILLVEAPPASAHGGPTPGVVSVAQTLGLHELTLTMYPPATGEGPMAVSVASVAPALDGPLRLQAVPAGSGGSASEVVVTPRTGTPATGTLQIDRPGAWEVVLVSQPDVARIPLSVPAPPPTPLWVWLLRAGLVVTLAGAIGAAAAGRRRPRAALGLGVGALGGAAVAVTAVLLSTSVAPPVAAPPDMVGMPGHGMAGMDMGSAPVPPAAAPATGAVVVTPSLRPDAGGLVALDLAVTDGSTGAPVDDLVIHDDALIHLAVIGPQDRLRHVHPVRVAPGRFSVRLPLSDPGGYGVFAEMERADGGHQVARSAFTLAASPGPTPAPETNTAAPGGPGPREVAGMRADVTTGTPVAGAGSRVEVMFTENGQPVRNLQAWLGMAGHLMILGPGTASEPPSATDPATSFAHVHDMTPSAQFGYGPTIGFDYAFPAAGRYQLWAQVQRNWQLVTIPIMIDVAPASLT